MKPLSILLSLLLICALAACSQPAPISPTATQAIVFPSLAAPTLTLAPVVVSPTPAGGPTAAPTKAAPSLPPAATRALATATKPASTATPQGGAGATKLPPTATIAAGFPQLPEAILIAAPGLTSAIVSPVSVSGQADPTFEQNLVAKVSGEDGLLISSKPTTIQAEAGKRGAFSLSLAFKVTKEQAGRVAVYSLSPKDGGLIHFSSVEVTLKLNGTASIQPGQQKNEVLLITQPAAAASASGGKLHVEGWSGPVFENQVVVILCGEGGSGKADPFCGTVDNILARVPVTIQAPDVGQPGPFSVDLIYKVSKAVSGRVAVYYTSPRDGYLLHLASVPVQLKP
jgi:hypothetical protein